MLAIRWRRTNTIVEAVFQLLTSQDGCSQYTEFVCVPFVGYAVVILCQN